MMDKIEKMLNNLITFSKDHNEQEVQAMIASLSVIIVDLVKRGEL